jgi:hypothetical protein
MEYKGVEYSVVQLTEGLGWRWEVGFDDGKNKSSLTPVSRAVARTSPPAGNGIFGCRDEAPKMVIQTR